MFSINCLEITVPKNTWKENKSLYKNLVTKNDYLLFLKKYRTMAGFKKRFFFNDFYKKEQYGDLEINSNRALPENFFGDNINVQAIVGKNGSGKSSLMDLMYMAINNFCYMFERNKIRPNSANLFFVKNLYINLYFSINQQEFLLENKNEDTGIFLWINNTKREDPECNRSFHIATRVDDGLNDEIIKEIVKPFFYTITSSYSVHAFISSNYNQDLFVFNRKSHYSDNPSNVCVDGYPLGISEKDPIRNPSWINSIFYKNDGYVRSLVINPYRNNGVLDMEQENQLAKYRLASLLIESKENNHKHFPEYELDYIKYSLNERYIEKKFPFCENFHEIEEFLFMKDKEDIEEEIKECNNELSELEKEKKDSKEDNDILQEIDDKISRTKEKIAKLKAMIQYLKLYESVGRIYCFGAEESKSSKAAKMYLVYKIDKVVYGYNMYKQYRESHTTSSGGKSLYEGNDENLESFFSDVRTRHSHSFSKIKQTLHFLDNINFSSEEDEVLHRDNLSQFDNPFNYDDYKTIMNNSFSSIDQIIEELPPPFFQYEIFLKTPNLGNISWNTLSSGELQLLHTLSTHAYHIRNLMSIDSSSIQYKNINLIFDELEICFHPEYQRQFVNKLVNMIKLFISQNNEIFFNVFLVTHSPFALSDIPRSNILYMLTEEDEGKELPKYTFAQNIGEMMYTSFFMTKTIGDFAEAKLKRLIKIKQGRNPDSSDEKYSDDDKRNNLQDTHKIEADAILNAIGDPVIRSLIEEIEKDEDSNDQD